MVEDILSYLEEFGNNTLVCKFVSISPETLYKWMRKYPDFAEQVRVAKEKFRVNNLDTEMGNLALLAAKEMMQNGKTIKTTTQEKKTIIYRKNPETKKMEKAEIRVELPTTQVKHYPCPEKLIQMYSPIDLDEARRLLESHGFLVIDPTIETQDDKSGISEEVYHQITGRILGVNTQTNGNGNGTKPSLQGGSSQNHN